MKKSLYILSTACLILLFSSCGNDTAGETKVESTSPVTADTAESVIVEDKYLDDLPDDLNLNNETVTFLYRAEIGNEFYVEEANGDVVNDAIYNSFLAVEERLNCDMDVVLRNGHLMDSRDEYKNHIKNSVVAGDDLYDWVDNMVGFGPNMALEGIFMDIAQNPYMDYTKPYYIKDMKDTVAIDGKLYFITGDASLGYLKSAFCIYFNQQLVADYGLEDPYTLVDEGRWTLETLMALSSQACQDTNGDGNYDLDDKLGFMIREGNHPKGFMAATDTRICTKDESGEWKLTYGTERDIDIANKIYKLIYNTVGSHDPDVWNARPEHIEAYNALAAKFAAGDIFMMTAEVDDAVVGFRDMENDFGILPFPKADEAQEQYYSSARGTHNSFSMPKTCNAVEAAGAVMEALSSSNHNTVFPAYFDVALKTKYARDNDAARMYDLIRNSMILDFAYTYSASINHPADYLFVEGIRADNKLASIIASKEKSVVTGLESYVEKIRSIAE